MNKFLFLKFTKIYGNIGLSASYFVSMDTNSRKLFNIITNIIFVFWNLGHVPRKLQTKCLNQKIGNAMRYDNISFHKMH